MNYENIRRDDLPGLVVEAKTDDRPDDMLYWGYIHAFDRNWWVPAWSGAAMGRYMDILCERLVTDGILKDNGWDRLWDTGHPTNMLRQRGVHATDAKFLWWMEKLPVAARSGAWTYHIPQDVERFLPPLKPEKNGKRS